ncbi:hypothetical protein [Streptomyces sp. SLBN-31]|uniref:hypothetical protein n=1 Tax=Streptomyces sp. SLBN-31 TaxID=2768444 RepID=UPI001150F1F7|nr:hypothetical protein [Streptomyces sp. SLBN-31]
MSETITEHEAAEEPVVESAAEGGLLQIRTLIVTAPAEVREQFRGLPTVELLDHLARSRPAGNLADPACAVRTALRRLARRGRR